MKLPKGIIVIDCDIMRFEGKNEIVIKNEEDFLWLINGIQFIFRLENVYYYLLGDIAYLYKEGK